MNQQLIYDIFNLTEAHDTLNAITKTRRANDNPNLIWNDDILEVESNITPKSWSLSDTSFACYALFESTLINSKVVTRSDFSKAVFETLPEMQFFLYNAELQHTNNAARVTEDGKTYTRYLIRIELPYRAVQLIDDLTTLWHLQDDTAKKEYLRSLAREVWKQETAEDKVPISIKPDFHPNRLQVCRSTPSKSKVSILTTLTYPAHSNETPLADDETATHQ